MGDQFQYVQLDERERYKTRLRIDRINAGMNPELLNSIELIDHASRIFCISSLEELTALTKDYENHFDPGNLALMPDTFSGATRMFVWVNNEAMWHEIVLDKKKDYPNLVVSKFDNNVRVAETGAVIHHIKFNWELNAPVILQDIDPLNINELSPETRSVYVSDTNIYEDTDFTLTVTDEDFTVASISSIVFRDKVFYGVSPRESITVDDLLLLNSRLEKDIFFDAEFKCNDEYIYYAIPNYMEIPKFIVFELLNNAWSTSSLSLVNQHGKKVDYTIYRSEYKQTGSNIKISIF